MKCARLRFPVAISTLKEAFADPGSLQKYLIKIKKAGSFLILPAKYF